MAGYGQLTSAKEFQLLPVLIINAAGGTCYLIALQHQMHIEAGWLLSFRGLGILTGLLTFLVFFVFLNKAWCGFICPLGFIQDIITKIREKLGIRFSRF